MLLTNVSAGKLGSLFWLNLTVSGFSGLYGLNHSDSAAHAKHYRQSANTKSVQQNPGEKRIIKSKKNVLLTHLHSEKQ